MRDFKNSGDLNIGGNLNITDNSYSEHKLLIHCSSEVLLKERPFREENLKIEQKKKQKQLLPFLGVTVILFLAAAIWAQINGKADLVSFVLGASSLIIGYASIQATLEPSAFERQERAAIEQINLILKSRRVE